MIIVSDLAGDVNEYLQLFSDKRPRMKVMCPGCGGRTHGHGRYERRVKENLSGAPVKVPIYRVRCTECGRTASLMPHFLRPYSPYSLTSHEGALCGYAFSPASLEKVAEERDLDPRTLGRWVGVFMGFWSEVTSLMARAILELVPGGPLPVGPCRFSREKLRQFFLLAGKFRDAVRAPGGMLPAVHLAFCLF